MKIHLLILLIQIINLNCFVHTILNCEKLDLNTNACSKCKDKHFPLFNNLFCLPCDDKDCGQIGCEGNCDSSRFENDRIVYCEPNKCKEGYYELNGLCLDCSLASPGCKRCSADIQSIDGQIDYKYKCLECLNDEYKMNENGICEKCEMDNCLKCRFNVSNKECLKCESDLYYLSSNKQCKRCHQNIYIPNGYCTICSDNLTDFESAKCFCQRNYFLNKNNSCSFGIEGCSILFLGKDNFPYCFK